LLDWPEIVLRLGVATLTGCAIGLNRDLQGKSIGLKTMGLVGLSTALVVLLAMNSAEPVLSDSAGRVIQGILTGIGFLGAGVIVRERHHFRVRGLTSAACTFLAACIGIACGAGHWRAVVTAVVMAFGLLILGRKLEEFMHRALGGGREPEEDRRPPPHD
jgi:putative Mg2+ transporter-C (MgtC) family protein